MYILSYSVISFDISCKRFTTCVCSITLAIYSRSNSPNLKSTNNAQRWLIDYRAHAKLQALKTSAINMAKYYSFASDATVAKHGSRQRNEIK